MAILPSLGEKQRNSPNALVAPTECRQDSAESDLPQWIEEGAPRLDHHPQAGVETFLVGASVPQCGPHEEERALKVLLKTTGRGSWRDGSWTPLCEDLIGASEDAILQVAEQVYWGEWTLAPRVLSHWQQDDCMREIWQELNILLGLAYRAHQVWLSPQEEILPWPLCFMDTVPFCRTMRKRGHQTAKRRLLWDCLGHKSNIPNWVRGAGQGGTKSLTRMPRAIPVTLPKSPK